MIERAVSFLVFDHEEHRRKVLVREDQRIVVLVRGYKPRVLPAVAETERKTLGFRRVDPTLPTEFPVVMLFVDPGELKFFAGMEVEDVGELMDYVLLRKSGSVVLQ